ncbi:MAG TPA: glycosyltransferase family 1 protein [Vicinamibacterales bacterium]|nr:glycosyltransferase family 1 protein [Vicinamibacterales bacterium]
MPRMRVAVIADLLEERWPSMDLVAEMLVECLAREHASEVDAVLIRPPMRHRFAGTGAWAGRAFSGDRILNRFYHYPRVVGAIRSSFDVFHVVDHSYAQLVHALPAAQTLVTCHDLDTFRSVLEPEAEPRSWPFKVMTRRILSGLKRAGHIACDTEATRDGLVAKAGIPAARTTVVHNGPHPSCTPAAEPAADVEAMRMLGRRSTVDLLHVGSTIARKRIETLLRVVASVRDTYPKVRLIRVGGPFTADQRALVRELRLDDAILVLPFLDRATLASVYRHSVVTLLPSEREGFGLPVLESLACGTPVIASDIDALREVGGPAATYCGPDDVAGWTAAITTALVEREQRPADWAARKEAGVARAAAFSWSRYAGDLVPLYRELARPLSGAGASS